MALIIKYYGINWKTSGIFRSLPLEWCARPNHVPYSPIILRSSTDMKVRKWLSIKLGLLAVTLLILLVQTTLPRLFQAEFDNSSVLIAWLLSAIYTAFIIDTFICYSKADEIAEMVNGFVQFDYIHRTNSNLSWKRLSFEQLPATVMTIAAILSQITLPIGFAFGLHWQDPWKPSIAGYWLITKRNSITFEPINIMIDAFSRLLVLSVNYWMWGLVMNGPCFAAGVLHTQCSAILTKNINLFRESISRVCGNRRRLDYCAATFRHIQLLNTLLNEVQRGTLIFVLIWLLSCLSLSLTISLLVLGLVQDMSSLATLMLVGVDSILDILVVLGGMSNVYKASRKALATKPIMSSPRDERWMRRFFKSCQQLKIKIGSVNFVDELTPLNCFDFSFSTAVDIILLNRSA